MKISNVASIVNQKIDGCLLDNHTYISTECMLPNCGGIEDSSSVPNGKVTRFEKNDILLSNIRPYFKKVWFSNGLGGCSNDVICIRTTSSNCSPKYLYYAICTDKFIDSFSASSKGTKMPRGDKNALMSYEIPDRSLEEQLYIVDILGSIDEKIEFFDSQIKLLEEQGQLLYKDIFESLTIKTEKIDLAKIAVFQNGYSYSGDELCEISADCLATIKNFDRQGGFKIDGFKPIKVAGKIKPEMYAEVGDLLVAHTDLTQNADIIGNPVLLLNTSTYKRVIISMDLVKVKSNTLSNELLYYILKSKKFKGHALGYCSGTTVLHLNKKALQEYTFDMPIDKEVIVRLEKQLSVIFDRIKLILKEIEQLKKLKELYLKKFFD